MAIFKALTSRGLIDVLHAELAGLGFGPLKNDATGVSFESNWAGCYKANLQLRSATRVVLPILDFPAYQPDELYHNCLKHDFTKYIDCDQTLAVNATVRDSSFRDQRFVAMKVKDAVVDQFRAKFDRRPDVNTDKPDLQILVRIVKNQVSIAIDTSGAVLSFRGYRSEGGRAPLKEHLAAGLLMLSGWDRKTPLLDPMCGSGTLLIEAALMARNIAPGTLRKGFGFERLKNFQEDVWRQLVDEALDQEKPEAGVLLKGSDIDGSALHKARRNAERAGVDEDITWETVGVDQITPPAETGLMIVNPPYGERLAIDEADRDVYRDLAFILKRHFKGWTLWLLSGNEELTAALRLKATRRAPVFNGPIECRFLKYEIR